MFLKQLTASFRDPSGFLFEKEGQLYRQINFFYKENYNLLMSSGLYNTLIQTGQLISHEDVAVTPLFPEKGYKVIKPTFLPFISYPYEWCFSQLKDAALLTLDIQEQALACGMSLKDCSAYNIQFKDNKPLLIDTLSFEKYQEGKPWVAYRQFCQHFLAPLALMGCTDTRLHQLFRIYIDGIPLDLASKLLPWSTHLKFSLFFHLHMHAKGQKYFADKKVRLIKNQKAFSKIAFRGLVDNLKSTIKRLQWKPGQTEWGDYYQYTNYSAEALAYKKSLVSGFIGQVNPKTVWDLGANDGTLSRLASHRGIPTVSFDIDPMAVEKNYLNGVGQKEKNLLPLLLDLANPSPGIGWASEERMSLLQRGPADLVMALALIHHLVISSNLPFGKNADFFSRICRYLIIEFIPKEDSQVQRLLNFREDIFDQYTPDSFLNAFAEYFVVLETKPLLDSKRVLFLMRNRNSQ